MENKTINNNPQRYSRNATGWEVSAIGDSPNRNPKREITPLELTKGGTTFEVLPILGVDGVVVEVEGRYLVSKKTIDLINGIGNPHWDILQNGSVRVKDRDAIIGKTIPIIRLDGTKWKEIGDRRDLVNKNAGVTEVDYTFEGEEAVSGIAQGLLEQINYTLGDYQRPGDSFSYYKYAEVNDPKYDITPLTIAAAQEAGPIDQTKLDTFLRNIDERLTQLSDDFNSIKRTFFYGELPNTSGKRLIRVENKIASSDDESPIVEHQYVEKTSTTAVVQTSRINAAIEATQPPTPVTETTPVVKPPRTLKDFEDEEKKKFDDANAKRSKLSKFLFGKRLSGGERLWKNAAKKKYEEAKKNGTL
jgi:hypothetical protein